MRTPITQATLIDAITARRESDMPDRILAVVKELEGTGVWLRKKADAAMLQKFFDAAPDGGKWAIRHKHSWVELYNEADGAEEKDYKIAGRFTIYYSGSNNPVWNVEVFKNHNTASFIGRSQRNEVRDRLLTTDEGKATLINLATRMERMACALEEAQMMQQQIEQIEKEQKLWQVDGDWHGIMPEWKK